MKTTNFAHKNTLAWIPVLYCLAFSFSFAGCRNEVLQTFSRLEKEASKYGTVSVGAVRVINYDHEDLEKSRKHLREALCRKRKKLLEDPNMVPQGYRADYASKYLAIIIDLIKPKEESKPGDSGGQLAPPTPKDPSTYFKDLSQVFHAMIEAQPPRPSEIELIGLRMAALKFIESQIEDVNLAKVYPVDKEHYRRVVVSLDFTAWVRGKAKAALVYIDLYPYEADSWCHETAEFLEELSEKAKKERRCIKGTEYKAEWVKTLEKLRGFAIESIAPLDPPTIPEEGLDDCVASCHRWLEEKKLRPRIIQVERIGQAEYLILGEGGYSGAEFQLGGAHPAGVSGTLKAGAARKAEGLMAKVRPLSLAFVAGERRAGWLFMPSRIEAGRMPPTERRLRMVVDIPKDLVKLGIHIHKVFLDADLRILPGAAFANQMANLHLTRLELSKAEQLYEKYKATEPRHYRLIKTRMRNLIYQGWPEEIVVDTPRFRTNREKK